MENPSAQGTDPGPNRRIPVSFAGIGKLTLVLTGKVKFGLVARCSFHAVTSTNMSI